jgi:hypothetical protein
MTTKISVQNIETSTLASITPPRITSIGYGGDDTATDTAGNVSVTLTGEGFAAGASVFIDGASAGSVSVVSSTQITFNPPAKPAGTYPLYVINSDGSSAIAIPGISYSGVPTYTTAAGNLANVYETTSFNSAIVATGDAPIAYSVYSGTLPPGANLSSTGNITGTSSSTASPTTYNFTVRASDAQNQDTNRPFSITVNPDIVIWGSPAAGAIIELAADAAMSNVSFIANSAAGYSVSYSANILPTGLSLIGSNVFGTPTVTGNTISVVTATSATTNRTANRTFTWVVSVAAEPYFKSTALLLTGNGTDNANNHAFVDSSTNAFALTRYGNATQGSFSPFSPTGWSAYFDGSGDYLTTSGFGLPTNFTLEFWSYLTAQPSGGHFTSASSMGPIISLETLKTILGQNGGYFLNPPNDSAVYPNGVSPLNQWNHWAVVRSSGTITFYLNGIKLGSAANSTDYTASQTFGIGAANDGSPVNVPHYMSNFRFSSVARYSGTSTTVANFSLPTANFTSDASTIFLGLTSNRFNDSGPNNRAITVLGDSKIVPFSPFAPTASYSTATHGGSMYFDGTGDYLTGPANNANVLLGTGDFTFEGWFYQTATNTYPGVLEIGVHTVNGILFIASNGSTITAYGPAGFMGTATAPPLNTWNHIAWVRSSGTFKIYVNGVGNAGTASASNFSDNTTTTFGGESTRSNATYTYSGYMSGVRLVKGTAVYTTNFTPPTAPLTAISGTSLLVQGTNAGIFDATGRNDLETVGDAKISTAVKKYGTGSVFLNPSYATAPTGYLYGAPSLTTTFGLGDFTIEFWFNWITTASRQDLFWWKGTKVGGILWNLSANNVTYYIDGAAINAPLTPTTNTWYHIALSRSSGTSKLFINGVQGGSSFADTKDYTGLYEIYSGRDQGAASNWVNGYIDDLRITKGVARYTTNFTPPTTFLLK